MEKKLVQEIIKYSGPEKFLALATIIKAKGSSPRKEGAQMLVYPDGNISGTIGGGETEGKVIEIARDLIKNGGGTRKLQFYMDNDMAAAEGGICGGNIDVFVETIAVD